MDYKIPAVYVEKVSSGSKPIEGVSTSVTAFLGVSPRGTDGKFVMVSSWSDYVEKAAFGCSSPFVLGDFMSYSIYNFYQNGGGKAYFSCVRGAGSVKALLALGVDLSTITAKYDGVWGNDISVAVVANAVVEGTFDVIVYKSTDVLETYTALSNTITDPKYYESIINNNSKVITASEGGLVAKVKTALATGSDGAEITDADYIAMLTGLDSVSDVSMLVNCGETSDTLLKGFIDYCTNRGNIYCILDAPATTEYATVITARNKLSGLGEIHHPYGIMTDPITGNAIEVPASGGMAGVYARFAATYGVQRAPAGDEAILRGFLGVTHTLSDAEFETLFAAGVNCIISKPNSGVVVYGARSLNQAYVTDDRLDIYVTESIKNNTSWALFELNDANLWLNLKARIRSFLDGMYRKGAFKGATAEEAYYVVCDETLNTEANIEKGIVTTEYGYANKKPAEFVVHRLNKITASSN